MANVYVRSGAAGAGTGADWANAYTTLAAAWTAKAAGDDFWISEDHAETQASIMSSNCPGSNTNPCRAICVDHAGTVPPVSADLRTTATISTTGNNSIALNGVCYFRGITYTAGNTTAVAHLRLANTTGNTMWFDNCALVLGGNSTNQISVGNASGNSFVRLTNTTMRFAATDQIILLRGRIIWENTASAILGTIPTTLFSFTAPLPGSSRFIGVDFSAVGSGKNLFDQSINVANTLISLYDCKLGASVSISTGTIGGFPHSIIKIVNCDSADTNYRYYVNSYQGTISQETSIVRTGGATNGVTPISFKMVSSANTKFYAPLQSDWILFWSDVTGSKTVTIPVLTDNVTLKDNQAWVEVEYLGTASFPLGLFASDAAADVLNAGTNQDTDSTSSWANAPGTPIKQSLSTTFTTTGKGLYRARISLAKASTTMYFDPLIATSCRQFVMGEAYINEEDASGANVNICGIGPASYRTVAY